MKTDTSSKLKYYQYWNVTKTDMSPKVKCHQIWNVTKSEMSPNLKCHQNWSFTKTELSPKLKCDQNWNVTKTESLPNIIMSSKIKIKIPDIGTEYLGLVDLCCHVPPMFLLFSTYISEIKWSWEFEKKVYFWRISGTHK